MTEQRLAYEAHLSHLRTEADAFAAAIEGALDELVPSCPGWTVRDLAEHLGDVFVFWRVQLEAADPSSPTEPESRGVPDGGDVVLFCTGAAEDLSAALAKRDSDEPCWNWSGREETGRFVARRMALEAAVHRFDAELAIGAPTAVDRELAIDGIDERIAVHLVNDLPETPDASLGGVICLACSDDRAAWTLEIGSGRVRCRASRAPADAVVVGSASDLFLFTWNRVGAELFEVTGDSDVVAGWPLLPV